MPPAAKGLSPLESHKGLLGVDVIWDRLFSCFGGPGPKPPDRQNNADSRQALRLPQSQADRIANQGQESP